MPQYSSNKHAWTVEQYFLIQICLFGYLFLAHSVHIPFILTIIFLGLIENISGINSLCKQMKKLKRRR